jgi:hypothetical protein
VHSRETCVKTSGGKTSGASICMGSCRPACRYIHISHHFPSFPDRTRWVSVLGHSQEHLVSIWKRNQKQKQRKTEGKIIKEQKAFKSGKKNYCSIPDHSLHQNARFRSSQRGPPRQQ